MRRFGHTPAAMRIGLVVMLVVSLALLGSAVGDGGQVKQKPTLRLAGNAPLTVRGTHFRPSERVRVTVIAEVRRSKRVTASRTGAFIARFDATFDRCSGSLIVRAVGAGGSEAALKLPQPACPAP
jgi:hypothetical protein